MSTLGVLHVNELSGARLRVDLLLCEGETGEVFFEDGLVIGPDLSSRAGGLRRLVSAMLDQTLEHEAARAAHPERAASDRGAPDAAPRQDSARPARRRVWWWVAAGGAVAAAAAAGAALLIARDDRGAAPASQSDRGTIVLEF